MDIKDIYIIANTKQFKRDDIVAALQAEGYKHNFFFGCGLTNVIVDIDREMAKADEVWTFGDCEKLFEYQYAKETGKDIWRMG